MDEIVERIGRKNNCLLLPIIAGVICVGTFCGVFRRQSLDLGARKIGADVILTGHNADDLAETILLNSEAALELLRNLQFAVIRGDTPRLQRCTSLITGDPPQPPPAPRPPTVCRLKPFKFLSEKDIVLYAWCNSLLYFSTECIYAPEAHRGLTREAVKEAERLDKNIILGMRTRQLLVDPRQTSSMLGRA